MTLNQIDNAIFWQTHVRNETLDETQRERCNARIESLMRERMELTRARDNAELVGGARQHAAWYDNSAELL